MPKTVLLAVVWLLSAVCLSSGHGGQSLGPREKIDKNELKELDIGSWNDEASSDQFAVEVNYLDFIQVMPAINRLDVTWTVTMATPDLAGVNVTWVDRADNTVVAACFVPGGANDTYYSTLGAEQCKDVHLEPCASLYHDSVPVDADGKQIGHSVGTLSQSVPLTDELNFACHLQFKESSSWIVADFYMINANQAPVNCSISWTDVKQDKQVFECSSDCTSVYRLHTSATSDDCGDRIVLEPDTEYRTQLDQLERAYLAWPKPLLLFELSGTWNHGTADATKET